MTGRIGRVRVERGVVDAVRSGLWVMTDASARKAMGSEGEWRMLGGMCLLLWQLESWTGVAYWVIGKLWE